MSLFLNQTIYYAYNIARCSSKQCKRSSNNNNNNNNSKNNKFKTYNKFYFFWEGPNAYNMHGYQQWHTTTTHTPMLRSLLNWCQFNTKIKHANSKPLGRKQNLRMHPKVFLSCIGICSGSFTGPSALCNTGNWFKLDCCTNATSISVCASSTAHSSSQSRSKQCASYSVWVALAGCYTFFNILQCSNDKCKRAVRIWVVIADNFTMLAMLASIYFICVDCMNGRPKMSSLGGVAKGNLSTSWRHISAEFLKPPCQNMLKLFCSLEANQECTPMWRRNHSWTVTWLKCQLIFLVSKCLQYKSANAR